MNWYLNATTPCSSCRHSHFMHQRPHRDRVQAASTRCGAAGCDCDQYAKPKGVIA